MKKNLTPETVEAIKNRITYFYYNMIMNIVWYQVETDDEVTFCEDYSPMATEMAMHLYNEHMNSLLINTENNGIVIPMPYITSDDEGEFELSIMPIAMPQIFYFDEETGEYYCDTNDVKTSDDTPVAYLDISEILANTNF